MFHLMTHDVGQIWYRYYEFDHKRFSFSSPHFAINNQILKHTRDRTVLGFFSRNITRQQLKPCHYWTFSFVCFIDAHIDVIWVRHLAIISLIVVSLSTWLWMI